MRRAPRSPRHRLLEIVARQVHRRLGRQVPVDELYDLGVPGLAIAHRDWDGRGRFDPFAMERIRWAVFDGLRKKMRDPMAMAALASELAAERSKGDPDELCAHADDVEASAQQTIDELVDDAAESGSVDYDTAGDVERDVERIRLRRAIGELPPPQDEVMERLCYRGETLQEIAESLRVGLTTVFDHHAAALRRLKRIFAEGPMQPVSA